MNFLHCAYIKKFLILIIQFSTILDLTVCTTRSQQNVGNSIHTRILFSKVSRVIIFNYNIINASRLTLTKITGQSYRKYFWKFQTFFCNSSVESWWKKKILTSKYPDLAFCSILIWRQIVIFHYRLLNIIFWLTRLISLGWSKSKYFIWVEVID